MQSMLWRTLLTFVAAAQAGHVANETSAAAPEEAAAAEPDKKAEPETQAPVDDKAETQVTAGETPALAAAQNGVGTAAEMNALAGVHSAGRAPHHAGHTLPYAWNEIAALEPFSSMVPLLGPLLMHHRRCDWCLVTSRNDMSGAVSAYVGKVC